MPLDPAKRFGRALLVVGCALLVCGSASVGSAQAATTFTVNSTNDANDGTCNGTHCSLREAMNSANSNAGSTITFNISGTAPFSIAPTSALPTMFVSVTIDGTTQPGYANAPLIELNGTGAGASTSGLYFFSGSNTVKGLVINRFTQHGIGFDSSSSNNTVSGNYIGTDTTGTVDQGNGSLGIFIGGGSGNTIGGTTSAARNVISGNTAQGIQIGGSGATGNVVQGNYIGTDVTGSVDLGNDSDGIFISSAPGNTIGGTTSAARNVISGNGIRGIEIGNTGATGNVVQGNYIGTDAAGTTNLGNSQEGVFLNASSSSTTVGGTAAGAGNRIAFNAREGVQVNTPSTGNSILGNSIFSNSMRGIDLAANGVTANDLGDADTGANNLQNYPVLALATNTGSDTVVAGTLNSEASKTYRVELFSSPSCDSGGNGEGQTFLTSTNVTTDLTGNAAFNVNAGSAVSGVITATATDPGGNTSEFSACRTVTGQPTISVDDQMVTEGNGGATNATFHVTLSAPSAQSVTVQYQTTDGTAVAPGDYTAHALQTLTFDPGQTSKDVVVAVQGDTTDEVNETYTVDLSSASNASILDNQGMGAITDDDTAPTISVDDQAVTEGSGGTTNATFHVTLSAASGKTVTVQHQTTNGTAVAPGDYTEQALQTLTFDPGQTNKDVVVAVQGDAIDEPDEAYTVDLSNAGNATIADDQGLGTILDDDVPPTPPTTSPTPPVTGSTDSGGTAGKCKKSKKKKARGAGKRKKKC